MKSIKRGTVILGCQEIPWTVQDIYLHWNPIVGEFVTMVKFPGFEIAFGNIKESILNGELKIGE